MRANGAIVPIDGGGGGGGGGGPFLELGGGTMTGDIDMGGHSLVNERLVVVETGISATTAALGLADMYAATAAGITITISTADIVEGRDFGFQALDPSTSFSSPVTITTEGGQTIDGVTSTTIVGQYGAIHIVVHNGELVGR
jgi:hypothetical protein